MSPAHVARCELFGISEWLEVMYEYESGEGALLGLVERAGRVVESDEVTMTKSCLENFQGYENFRPTL